MESYDLAIIGTGSGNSILDDRFSKKRVALCEQGVFGGTCLNVGCIPTKMFVYAAEVAATIRSASRYGVDAHVDRVRWDDIVSRVFGRIDPIAIGGEDYRRAQPNIDVYDSRARFAAVQHDGRYLLHTDDGNEFTAEKVVIAAGARPEVPPAILDCGVHFYTSDDIMRIPKLPKHMVIIGGGFVACEFAHIFSALGVRITMVIRGGSLLRHLDDTLSSRFTRIASSKWEVRSHRNILGSHESRSGGIVLELDDGSELKADVVLVATGRRSNGDRLDAEKAGIELADRRVVVDEYQRTSARNVFALGDVSSPYELKHVANHEARVVQRNVLHDWDDTASMVATDHRNVPAAVFTDPQIAYVGLTENEAVAQGFEVSCKVQDYADVAYGWAAEDTVGIVKLISDSQSGRLLGAHIMGHQASSIIQPLIQAMAFGLSVQDMARGQYWIHPALPEVVENALLGLSD
jgi:mycothione reductase